MGDFNFPFNDWRLQQARGNSCREEDFVETIKDLFLFHHILPPTRCHDSQISHILDLIITDKEFLINNLQYQVPLGNSDHSILKFDIGYNANRIVRNQSKYLCDKGLYPNTNAACGSIEWLKNFK